MFVEELLQQILEQGGEVCGNKIKRWCYCYEDIKSGWFSKKQDAINAAIAYFDSFEINHRKAVVYKHGQFVFAESTYGDEVLGNLEEGWFELETGYKVYYHNGEWMYSNGYPASNDHRI